MKYVYHKLVSIFCSIFAKRGFLCGGFSLCNRFVALLIVGLILSSLSYSCKNTSDELIVLYDKDFNYVKKLAKKKNKALCIVLTRPDCPPCQHYVQRLSDFYSNTIVNVVDIYMSENQWYTHWLCIGASPTTAIFSPKGELKAVISGGARTDILQCVNASILGDTKCSEYFYHKHFPVKGEVMPMLNTLLSAKQKLEKGKDVSDALDLVLTQSEHPYAVYLKSLNEAKQGRDKEAIYWGNRFLSMVNRTPFYIHVYSNSLKKIRPVVNPNYNPADDGVLSVIEELPLGDFKLHESHPFSVTIANTGNSPLQVHDIILGCSCVTFGKNAKKQYTLQPGQFQSIDFVFTADVQGDVFREIMFFSDGVNPLEIARITASVK